MPRFVLNRDVTFFESISSELVDDVVETIVSLYKLVIGKSSPNIYGESMSKTYYTPVNCTALIERSDTSTQYEGFGSDTVQTVDFRFNKFKLKEIGFYPEIGDIFYHNNAYFEVSNVREDQLVGGQTYNKYSIICETFMTRISTLQIEQRRI
jgi:hypothetical protein